MPKDRITSYNVCYTKLLRMKDAVESWNKANPKEQIELKIDVLPYDDLHNKLLISLQAGTGAPDLADIEIVITSYSIHYTKLYEGCCNLS